MGGGSPAWRETHSSFLLFPPRFPTGSVPGAAKEGDQESQPGVAGEKGRFLKQPIWFFWGLAGSCVWGPDKQTPSHFLGAKAGVRDCFGLSGHMPRGQGGYVMLGYLGSFGWGEEKEFKQSLPSQGLPPNSQIRPPLPLPTLS